MVASMAGLGSSAGMGWGGADASNGAPILVRFFDSNNCEAVQNHHFETTKNTPSGCTEYHNQQLNAGQVVQCA
jgi:hypothetical protein